MDRASGWYKRRVQLILFFLALGLTSLVNADTLAIGQRLWKDDALRAAVVAQANRVVQQGSAECAQTGAGESGGRCRECVDAVNEFGLPLGWTHTTSPHSFWATVGKILGLLVTAFALALGAPFWFDLISKVSRVRGSGPRPRARSQRPAKN